MPSLTSLLRLDEALVAASFAMIGARVRNLEPARHLHTEAAPLANSGLFVHTIERGDRIVGDASRDLDEDLAALRDAHGAASPAVAIAFHLATGHDDDADLRAYESGWRAACRVRGVPHVLVVPLVGAESTVRDAVFSWADEHDEARGEARRPSANELYAAVVTLRPSVHAQSLEVFDELLRLADATLRKSSFDAFDASVLQATLLAIGALAPGRMVVQSVARHECAALRRNARVAGAAKAFVESLVSSGLGRGLRSVFYAPKGLSFEARRSLADAPLDARVRYDAKVAMLTALRGIDAAWHGLGDAGVIGAFHPASTMADAFLRWFGVRPRATPEAVTTPSAADGHH